MPDISNLFAAQAPVTQPVQNAFDITQTNQNNNAKNQYLAAQTSGQMSEQQQKLRSMQQSMLGALSQLPPDQYESARSNIIPIVNKLNPSVQFDDDLDQGTAGIIAKGGVSVGDQPSFALNQAKAALIQRIAGGGQQLGSPAPQNGQTAAEANGVSVPNENQIAAPSSGGLSPTDSNLMAILDPNASNALSTAQKTQYDSPAGKQATAEAEEKGKNIVDANKGVAGIDSRIQNAINILDDQIDIAPKTVAGKSGEYLVDAERNLSNLGIKFDTPVNQQKFEQNNANLFTQELPAIISGMPGSRLDLPLVKAIKDASAINENGTIEEKIASAQNLKSLLQKYQQNTHNYATAIGGGNAPIASVNDRNPQTAAQQASAKLKPTVQNNMTAADQAASIANARAAIAANPQARAQILQKLQTAGINPGNL